MTRRRLTGADLFASEWKYIAVQRTGLFIEEGLCRGRNGSSSSPTTTRCGADPAQRRRPCKTGFAREPFRARHEKGTTTQDDINVGVANILVGFAPLKPAEFVVIMIQQKAGQIAIQEECHGAFAVNAQRFDA